MARSLSLRAIARELGQEYRPQVHTGREPAHEHTPQARRSPFHTANQDQIQGLPIQLTEGWL